MCVQSFGKELLEKFKLKDINWVSLKSLLMKIPALVKNTSKYLPIVVAAAVVDAAELTIGVNNVVAVVTVGLAAPKLNCVVDGTELTAAKKYLCV